MLSNGRIPQDIWIKNRVALQAGLYDVLGNKTDSGPSCFDRYNLIRHTLMEVLGSNKMPLFVVDVGSCYGYFPIRLYQDFAQVNAILIEELETDWLKQIIVTNEIPYGTFVVMKDLKQWLKNDYKAWWNVEHVSVLLLLNVLHHLPNWQDVMAEVPKYDYVFIQTPHEDDVGTDEAYKEISKLDRVRDINRMMKQSFDIKLIGSFMRIKGTFKTMCPMWFIRRGVQHG